MMDAGLPPDLHTLETLPSAPIVRQMQANEIPELRVKIIRDAACAVGARGGLYAQAAVKRTEIDGRLAPKFDAMFPFGSVMLQDGLYPPVISKVENATRQDGDGLLRISGTIYQIERTERFSLQPITWHSYVYRGLPAGTEKVPMPHPSLLPKTDGEKALWSSAVRECWAQGVVQADAIVDANIARMDRDFSGMLLYKILVLGNKISAPQVEYAHEDVTGGGNRMVENDRSYRISSPSGLNPNQATWK